MLAWRGWNQRFFLVALRALLVCVLTAPVWLPYLHPRLDVWATQDAENHLFRLYALEPLLRQGVLFPRWLPDLLFGFGQPITLYYAPGLYYFAILLHWLGRTDLYGGFQLAGAAIVCLAAAGMALLVRRLTGNMSAACFAAAVFAYSPYPFPMNLYYRGALPEALATALLPWAALGFVETARTAHAAPRAEQGRSRLVWTLLGAVAGAAAVLSHNMLGPIALATSVVLGFSAALAARPRGRAVAAVCLVLLGALGLSAFFWLPVASERSLVRLDDVITQEHVDYRDFLIQPLGASIRSGWPGYLYTPVGPLDFHPVYAYDPFAPIKPSWLQVVPAVLALTLVRRSSPTPRHALIATAALATGLAAWWITTTWSMILWDRIRALQALQFPYRPLGIVAFAVALLGGMGAARLPLPRLFRVLLLVALPTALAFTALAGRDPRTAGATPRLIDAARFRTLDQMAGYLGTTAREEFMPRTVRIDVFSETDPRVQLFAALYPESAWIGGALLPYRGQASVLDLRRGGLELRARIEAGPDGATLAVRQLDFPGWTAYLDDRFVSHGRMPYRRDVQATLGFILVDIPPGIHDLALSFELTPPRLAGQVLSALTLAALCAAAAWPVWRGRMLRHLHQSHAAPHRVWLASAVLTSLAAVLLIAHAGYTVVDWSLRQSRAGRSHAALTESLVLNVARAVEEKTAAVESPSGAALGPDRFADLRWLQLGPPDETGAHGGSLRRWLYLHPPARVTAEVDVPAGGVLQTGLALDPATWDTPEGDGVRFIVEAREVGPGAPGAGSSPEGPVVLFDRHINPRARTEERGWNDVTVDLSRFAGRRVRLTLRTDPAGNLAYDWAGWGNPVVVTRPSARWR